MRDFDFDLDAGDRAEAWRRACDVIEASFTRLRERALGPECSDDAMSARLSAFDFETPMAPKEVLDALADGVTRGQVQTGHPRYFGLLHAAPSAMATVAGAIASAYNPQLATRSHAPFAVALEERLVRAIGSKFGWSTDDVEGAFTGGGAEANLTALTAALARAYPSWPSKGVRALPRDVFVYASIEAHPTVVRAARIVGLGSDAVKLVPTDGRQRMKTATLRETLARDRAAGASPLMIVATAGTTSSGAIDSLSELATTADKVGAWLHVDAAWGGLLAFVPEARASLEGLERADSITFDPHKALSLPLGAGMFLTRRRGLLATAFQDRAGYMPRDPSRDPYARSLAWSRRFVGAQLFATLAVAGWEGLAASLRRQIAVGARLRAQLVASGWNIVNDTPLPVTCFRDATRMDGGSGRFLDGVARAVVASGGGWLSVTRLATGARVLRASVTNHRTRESDVDHFVSALAQARASVPEPERGPGADGAVGEPGPA